MQVADAGVLITYTPTAGTGNLTNLTGYTVTMVAQHFQTGTEKTFTMTVDPVAGAFATYTTTASDFTLAGQWSIQFHAKLDANHDYHSTVQTITVGADL